MDVPRISTDYRVGFRAWYLGRHVAYDPESPYLEEPEEVPTLRGRNGAPWNTSGPTRCQCRPADMMLDRHMGTGGLACEYPPTKSCSCGLYCYHLPARRLRPVVFGHMTRFPTDNQAYGAVLGWGRRFRHGEEGFRAEYMLPVAFLIPPEKTWARPAKSQVELIVELADRLDAKIFSRPQDMARFAFTKGSSWHPLGQEAVDEYFGERRWSRGVHDTVR